jgi:hypothetical protein
LGAEEGQLAHGKEEGSVSFDRNIVYLHDGPVLGWHWSKGEFRFDRNVYWDARKKPITFAGATLEEWRKRGMDIHSVVADPLFVDPDHGDFTLRAQVSLIDVEPPWATFERISLSPARIVRCCGPR